MVSVNGIGITTLVELAACKVSYSCWRLFGCRISVGDYTMNHNWEVISDTGTSLIGAPSSVLRSVAQTIGATFHSNYGLVSLLVCVTKIPPFSILPAVVYVNYVNQLEFVPLKNEISVFHWLQCPSSRYCPDNWRQPVQHSITWVYWAGKLPFIL